MEVGKDIFKIEFFMPNGEIRKYAINEEVDGKAITGIAIYENFVRISLVETVMTSSWSGSIVSSFLTMPTSIPYSTEYLESRPWYAQPHPPHAKHLEGIDQENATKIKRTTQSLKGYDKS